MTEPTPPYIYRRQLSAAELLPAIGAAIGAGLLGFYVARVLLERTPLEAAPREGRLVPAGTRAPRAARDDHGA